MASEGLPEADLIDGKGQLKGQLMLALEARPSRMYRSRRTSCRTNRIDRSTRFSACIDERHARGIGAHLPPSFSHRRE